MKHEYEFECEDETFIDRILERLISAFQSTLGGLLFVLGDGIAQILTGYSVGTLLDRIERLERRAQRNFRTK